jgi:hypothetical protein
MSARTRDARLKVVDGGGWRKSPRRGAVAKDRTLRRLLQELVALGENASDHQIVTLTRQLRSVLLEIGHDV